jgi:hypothetical protein
MPAVRESERRAREGLGVKGGAGDACHGHRVELLERGHGAEEEDDDATALNGLDGARQQIGRECLKVLWTRTCTRRPASAGEIAATHRTLAPIPLPYPPAPTSQRPTACACRSVCARASAFGWQVRLEGWVGGYAPKCRYCGSVWARASMRGYCMSVWAHVPMRG